MRGVAVAVLVFADEGFLVAVLAETNHEGWIGFGAFCEVD